MRKHVYSALAACAVAAAALPTSVAAQGGQPFLSQQMLVGFTFCPRGWSDTHNQLLPINSWQSLYSLLGTTYGGDGRTTFALPALRSRIPIGVGTSTTGTSYAWGARSGIETVTLLTGNMAGHTHGHVAKGTTTGPDSPLGTGALLATTATNLYAPGNTTVSLNTATIVEGPIGSSTLFDIRMPYETIRTCIAMEGIFPSRN